MQTRKIAGNWTLTSVVAAMLAVSATAVFAQTNADSAPSMPAGPTSTTDRPATPADGTMPMSSMPMSGSMTDSMGMPSDYKILNNRIFDHVDLSQAEARGLSDSQIATVVKICKETGMPFNQVVSAVERGATFPSLASTYGLRLGDLYSVNKEKQEISDYKARYASETSLSSGKGMMADSMMPAPMSSETTSMAPPMAAPMMPSSGMSSNTATMDIVDTAMAAKNLTTLVQALQIAGLTETLKGTGPFTVFAPDNKAFSMLPAGALAALEADPAKLKMVLSYHVIPANIMASDAMNMTSPTSPPTVEGATLQVTKGKKGHLKVNDATVVKADIQASNGVIHIINRVLMPPMDATAPMDTTAPMAPDATAPAPMAPAAPGQ